MVTLPYALVIIAGICAGAWPLVMQKSGLGGASIALVYSACSLMAAVLLYLATSNGILTKIAPINWWPALGAGALAAAALLLLSMVVEKTSPDQLSLLYIVMLLVQISIPALFYIILNRGITLTQAAGLAAALLAAWLLR